MTQRSFSTLWDGFESDTAAKAARDTFYRTLKSSGIKAKRFVLKHQIRQYSGFGQPDGRSCDVYMIDFDGYAAADAGLTF